MKRIATWLLLVLCANLAEADEIIWDQSPASWGGVHGFTAFNIADVQNFTDAVRFDQDHLVTGIDIYSSVDVIDVGNAVVVRIFADAGGVPGALLVESPEGVSIRDSDGSVTGILRFHADLSTPVLLNENTTYWVGMSGSQQQLGQDFINDEPPFGDSRTAQMSGLAFDFLQGQFGDQAFRLHGRAIPEPATVATLLVAVICGSCFRQRTSFRQYTSARH